MSTEHLSRRHLMRSASALAVGSVAGSGLARPGERPVGRGSCRLSRPSEQAGPAQTASAPRSPVRMRTISSIVDTQTLPSPIRPV